MPAAPGSTLTRSAGMTVCCRVVLTSTSGTMPSTVTVSSRPPTAIAASTSATNAPCSRMPSRTTTLKPGSVNLTE